MIYILKIAFLLWTNHQFASYKYGVCAEKKLGSHFWVMSSSIVCSTIDYKIFSIFQGTLKGRSVFTFFHARLLETFRWVNFIDGAETSNVRD